MPFSHPLTVLLLGVAPMFPGLAAASDRYDAGPWRGADVHFASLSTTGSSGALSLPDGGVLEDGTAVFGLNNSIEPEFYNLKRNLNYQFGIGLLPHLELSGRLANYPGRPGHPGVRDLSANIKVSLPKIFRGQPDIAFGMNDLSGGAPFFESKYVAISDTFGPVRLNIGKARGKAYLNGLFASAEVSLWNTGASIVAERANDGYVAGVRYVSPPLRHLVNSRVVLGVQRSFGAQAPDGTQVDRSAVALSLMVPFGSNARNPRKLAMEDEPIWTPPKYASREQAQRQEQVLAPIWTPPGDSVKQAPATDGGAQLQFSEAVTDVLERIQQQVENAGLERVRVGMRGRELVIEYENHRYNHNEVDAIGIVLGIAATVASDDVADIAVVTKKAGLALYQVVVGRADYRQFLRAGADYDVKSSLAVRYRPGNGQDVHWLRDKEGARGYSRVRIDPQLIKFVGTELGVFDYSLSANIQAFVPLWKGAEIVTSYVQTLAESDDVKHGFLGYAQQPNKLKAAMLSQSFWLTDQVLNVTSAGKLYYNATGFQNETTWFLPYRDDQVRVYATRMHHVDFYGLRVDTRTVAASYLWAYRPMGLTAELTYNRYQSKDKGPSLQLSRWFGDVQAQAYLRTSNLDKKIGFSLAFPLTPRQGMRPGWTHLEGMSSFPFKLETRLASKGECNCITNGVVEELPMVYSARGNLLNHARIGKDYLSSQLQRMREAALVYASVVP